MKSLLYPLIFVFASHICIAQQSSPKLVVGIVIDQMKQEYLYRFNDKFGEDGFKKIISNGFTGKNTHYNYIPTKTAAGHASIYTGTTPRYHGIIANEWYSKALGRKTYCVSDTTVEGVGNSNYSGQMSPRNLQSTTITDELKLTTNFKSKVVGVSIKDRGSILPAGHTPDGAYWYDSKSGKFISSTFYCNELPSWVTDFNNLKLVDRYLNQSWNTTFPIEEYVESTADNSPYENLWKGKDSPVFPYNLKKLREKNGPYSLISSTPFGNSLVLNFAKSALENQKMGMDKTTDFLAVSLSSTDYVGHAFAPNAIELEDTYIKLDKDLADFLSFLDSTVGKDEYVLFITADHGVVANPQFLIDNNLPGGYILPKELKSKVKSDLEEKFGEGDWVLSISNEQVFLNDQLIGDSQFNKEEIANEAINALYELPQILEVYAASDMKFVSPNDHLGNLLNNGYNRKKSGDVLFSLKPGYLLTDYGNRGTTHGSGYTYDTHVPLLFYGKGIKSGSSTSRRINITDIAPTLSSLLNISLPSACTGQPITEIFE